MVVNDLPPPVLGEQPNPAQDVVEEILGAGGQAVVDHSDISTPEGGRALVARALDAFGAVDIIINNAGVLRDCAFHKMGIDAWQSVRRVHLDGAFHVTRAAWPHMREQRFGRVVVTTSGAGTFGNFGQANYSAAKLGLVGLVNTLAIEGAKCGITANAVSPVADTRMTKGLLTNPDAFDPAFVSPAVVYLVSEECETTGEIIRAGGGNFARVAYVVSRGTSFNAVPTVEQIAERWQEMLDLSGAAVGKLAL